MEPFLFNLYQLYFVWEKNSPILCYRLEWSPRTANQGKHYAIYSVG